MPETDLTVRATDAWELAPPVALRPEPFGALAYHFGNRRLTFLKRPELVGLVRALAEQPDVEAAMASVGIAAQDRPAYLGALGGLARTDMIRRRDTIHERQEA